MGEFHDDQIKTMDALRWLIEFCVQMNDCSCCEHAVVCIPLYHKLVTNKTKGVSVNIVGSVE